MKTPLILVALCATASVATAQTTVFYDNFENGANDATLDDTLGSYSQTDNVGSSTGGDTTKKTNATLWQRADQGFGADRHGLIDEAGGDVTDPSGEQAYAFRYTNSGITTKQGVIGGLLPGATYKITFNSSDDIDGGNTNNTTGWSFGLLTFDGGARNDTRDNNLASAVLTSATGNAPAGGAYQLETINYTVDPIAASEVFGHDVALRFYGATDSANIDDVKVEITEAPNFSYWDIDGATPGSGGATPSGTWDAATTNWDSSPEGSGAAAAWVPANMALFAAGADATGAYNVTVDGVQSIGGIVVEEGAVSLIDGAAGGLEMAVSAPFVAPAGTELSIGVPITDATGAEVFTKGGAGKLTLSGDNSLATGGMVLNNGVTQFDSLLSINGTGANVLIQDNGVLSAGGSITDGDIASVMTRIDPLSTGTVAVDGYATADFDFATDGLDTLFLGAITDTIYSGTHTPSSGTYRLGGAGGKLTLSDASGINTSLSTPTNLTMDVRGLVEISDALAGTGNITLPASAIQGTLILSGANTHDGNYTLTGSTLRMTGTSSGTGSITINGAARLQLDNATNGGIPSGDLILSNNNARVEAINADRAISNNVQIKANPKFDGSQAITVNGLVTNDNNRELWNNIDAPGSLDLAGGISMLGNRRLSIRGDISAANINTNVSGNIVNADANPATLELRAKFRDDFAFTFSGDNSGFTNGLIDHTNGWLTVQGAQAMPPVDYELNHKSGENGRLKILDDSVGTINLSNDLLLTVENSTGSHRFFVGNNNTANGGNSAGTTTGSVVAFPSATCSLIAAGSTHPAIEVDGANDYALQINSLVLNNLVARTTGATMESRLDVTASGRLLVGNITMADGNAGPGNDGVPLLVLMGATTTSEVTGVISNPADAGAPLPLEKRGSGTWTLSGANTYTGDTFISGGTLALVGGSQASAITVGSSGSLGFEIGSPTTSSSSVDLTNGTVVISNPGAVNNSSDYLLMTAAGGFTFTDLGAQLGTVITDYALQLQNGNTELWLVYTGGGGSTYASWANGSLPGDDDNGDGVSNAVAYALGAADPDTDARSLLPTSVYDDTGSPTYLVFTFNRDDDAEADVTTAISVQYGSSLGGWTTASHDPGGTGVIINETGSAPTNVEVKIPVSLAVGDRMFARLNVVVTP